MTTETRENCETAAAMVCDLTDQLADVKERLEHARATFCAVMQAAGKSTIRSGDRMLSVEHKEARDVVRVKDIK